MMRSRGDAGETLVEVMLTIVVIGLTLAGLLSGLATVSNAGTAQRNSVQSDVVLRNYAEAAKSASQRCVAGAPYTVAYTPPTAYPVTVTVVGDGAVNLCPAVGTTTTLTLLVTGPRGFRSDMDIKLRSP
jgi:type II secretory pathway pseudopilin PulG